MTRDSRIADPKSIMSTYMAALYKVDVHRYSFGRVGYNRSLAPLKMRNNSSIGISTLLDGFHCELQLEGYIAYSMYAMMHEACIDDASVYMQDLRMNDTRKAIKFSSPKNR